uniref:Amyloid protein 2 like n=1 Tax=Echinococcus granulosus TaxID=6210 RepID=A0A068WSR1_ECHGR|nr:amyloid protein 2 like [Echinococcus granulosus]
MLTGLCRAYIKRWAYNATSGDCERLIYGGCGGNKNQFKTKKECRRTCVKTTKRRKRPKRPQPTHDGE